MNDITKNDCNILLDMYIKCTQTRDPNIVKVCKNIEQLLNKSQNETFLDIFIKCVKIQK